MDIDIYRFSAAISHHSLQQWSLCPVNFPQIALHHVSLLISDHGLAFYDSLHDCSNIFTQAFAGDEALFGWFSFPEINIG